METMELKNETMIPDEMDLNDLLKEMDETAGEKTALEEPETFPAELFEELDLTGEEIPAVAEEPASGEAGDPEGAVSENTPSKPKRATRKKKTEPAENPSKSADDEKTAEADAADGEMPSVEETAFVEEAALVEDTASVEVAVPVEETALIEETSLPDMNSPAGSPSASEGAEPGLPSPENMSVKTDLPKTPSVAEAAASSTTSPVRRKTAEKPVLTIINRDDVETEASREEALWHEIHNAYRTRKIMTGQLGGIEQLDNGKTIAIVDYKGFRIIIPLKEMMINLGKMPSGPEYAQLMQRQNKILGNMLGAEIDFVVKGIDSKTRSVVASRRDAMIKKRQIFYLETDTDGMYRIFEGRVVQARVIAVAEKVIRVEVFGVECSIMARDLTWDWIGDAHERFSVGDVVLVRILSVHRDDPENISIKADIKSVSQNTSHDNLKKCRIQSKYAGKVTDVYKGVVYIRLANGVNAVAHSCFDHRTPGKKDDVSFAVTKLDEERGVAVGIITRIIKQNL